MQSTVFWNIRLAGVRPNLLVVVVVLTAYMRGQTDGLFTGLACGLLIDMVYGGPLGLYGVVLMLVGYLVGYANYINFNDDFTVPLVLVGLGDFVYSFAYYAFEFLLRGRTNLPYYFMRIMLPEMVYTLAVSVVMLKLMHSLEKRLSKEKKEEE